MLFSLLILLVYSLLMFLQLANQTSSNKIKVYFPQNFCNSLVPQHTQKTGNQTSWTVQTTKKKFNYFKTCNSWLWKRWKLSNYDISGSMRRLTFRRSRLKTKSSHTEQWLPLNNMKVYGLNIRGVTTSGGSNNCTVEKDDPDHFPSFGCSKNVLCSAHSQITWESSCVFSIPRRALSPLLLDFLKNKLL